MSLSLPPHQYALLAQMAGMERGRHLAEIAGAAGLDQSLVAAAATELAEAGWVAVIEEPYEEVELLDAGRAFLASGETLPEIRMAAFLRDQGPMALPELAARLSLDPKEAGKLLRFLFSKGLAKKEKGVLAPAGSPSGEGALDDVRLLRSLAEAGGGPIELDEKEA